jgi:hypothetical protein
VRALVAERYTCTHRERGNIRARGISMRSMEHFRRWSVADGLREMITVPAQWPRDVAVVTALTGHELIRLSRNADLRARGLRRRLRWRTQPRARRR